jgi:hypothetical protein
MPDDMKASVVSGANSKAALTVTRGPESWQFFAFVFGAFAAIGLALADDLVTRLPWRVLIKLGWFALTFYVFMVNGRVREKLVRLLAWVKVENG